MNIGLDKKILGGFIFCCLILFAVAIASFRNSEKFVAASDWVGHTHEVLFEFEQIMVNVIESETGARGFVITGNEDFLVPFNTSKNSINAHLRKVRSLISDNTEQQQNVIVLTNLTEKHIAQLNNCVLLRRENQDVSKIIAATVESRRILNDIRSIINNSREMEERLLSERETQSQNDQRNFSTLFIVLLCVILVVLLAVYIIITTNLRALRKLEKEREEKNWILTGTGELIRGMQGNKTVPDLGHEILRQLTAYLNLPVASFYTTQRDNVSLRLTATYALNKKTYDAAVISFGEGFAGQVAAEKRTMIFSDLGPEHYSLNTSFGPVRPKFILAFPFIFENAVVGVIELGSLKEFTEQHQEYLRRIADGIAIAVTSSQAREITKELLEETQRQGEELESQQVELRQYNEELHAKTEMLENSETELKAQQAELEHANIDLEEKATTLAEQKEALEDAKIQIEKKATEVEISSRYKSEFLANMSHELRTPLNSILILAQLLAENKSKLLGEKEVDFARNIHTSGTGLLNLINEILDLSKIEAGKMELDIESFSVANMVHTVREMIEGIANSKAINFETKVDQDVQHVNLVSDRQRIEQILRNLLSNAMKFTPAKGTVTLSVGLAPEKTRYNSAILQSRENILMLSVKDTGIGIPENKRELVFQAFQQADGSTKRKYGGTGLGLSISRELSIALGGEIQLSSEEGKGSTFTLFLPVEHLYPSSAVAEKQSAFIEDSTEPNQHGGQENIPLPTEEEHNVSDDRHTIEDRDKVVLIIEDDDKFANILLNFIRERGYKGVIAAQGNTGLSFARHYKPVAILLDMNLPIMNGDEVIRRIKIDPALRHIPVQVISAYDKKKEGMLMGAFDYLPKPVSLEDLQHAFDRIEVFSNKKLKKLLIVEDDQQQNNAIRELIGEGDIKTSSAHSGESAYEMLEAEAFDCMIIDLGLPDMSGFDLMEKIKANAKMRRIPIIVYTGRDLKKEDNIRLSKLADTVVLKTANSQERLLDETILFLHRVESKLPKEKQSIIRKLHKTDEILKDKKILLVDDDIRNIYSLTNALEEEGIHCMTAENGKVAIDTLTQQPDIDLILMDVMMPEMDGYEATQEIRKMNQFKKLPIIALTAKAMKGDKEKCLAVGMSDYVSKPVNVSQLLSLMRVWLYK